MSSLDGFVCPTEVEFSGLRQEYEAQKVLIDAAVRVVIKRSAFIDSPEPHKFETWSAGHCGVTHSVGVSSGTTAIELVLRALGIGRRARVNMAANTFIATAAAISATGARPTFVAVKRGPANMDPVQLGKVLTARVKATLPVHLYGQPCDMRAICAIAAQRGVSVIEDAAHAHGARYRRARVGSIGIAGCFSFYPVKNLGAFGDGGLVSTNDQNLADEVASSRIMVEQASMSIRPSATGGHRLRL